MSVRGVWRPRSFLRALVAAVSATSVVATPVFAQDDPPDPPATTTTTSVPTTTVVTETTTTTAPDAPTTTTTPAEGDETTTTTVDDGPAPAPRQPIDNNLLVELLKGYDEAVAMEAELLAQFEISVADMDGLNSSLVELSDRITEVQNELLAAETDLAEAEGQEHLVEMRLEEIEEDLLDARERLEQQAVDAYIYGGSAPQALAMLSAETVSEMETTREYASVVTEQAAGVIDEYAGLRVEADALSEEAESARRVAEISRDEVQSRHDVLETERDRQAKAQADAFVAAVAQQELIDEANARRDEYELRLQSLRGTSDSISNVLGTRQRGQSLPDETDHIFLPPVKNGTVVSSFGPRLHPIYGTVRMHDGADIDGSMGTPIRAAEDGVVVMAEWRGGYGWTTVIDHGNGLGTLYAHQSRFISEPGDEVEMGDVIGLVGSTGFSTGPHLHFEVRVFGNPVQPLDYLGGEELLVLKALSDEEEEAAATSTTVDE